ncbi:MAG: chromosome partitioning protein ParB [Alphaproteobacteria bacterium]|nr:chromosome partitioning protein ParB [Alphaproteobacteria bacterium]
MTGKGKFGFEALAPADIKPRKRDVGPMGAAVREAAGSLAESTESLIEQRRQNATDAKAFRAAQGEGRVLELLRVDDIRTDDLPRDRIDLNGAAGSDEMEELKASIRARGQREPIEVFSTANGFQLKKGWRRLTALKQLWHETGDARFSTVTARIAKGPTSRIDLYIDMVEENVIREDLSFAEMAQVAITAAHDEGMEGHEADALVGRLYASLHKMKRSYIRSFVFLLQELGDAIRFPKAISRNLGVEVARQIQAFPHQAEVLKNELKSASSADEQNALLSRIISGTAAQVDQGKKSVGKKAVKYEFHVGSAKVTARKGECRILSNTDFSSIERARLQKAIEAFQNVLKDE